MSIFSGDNELGNMIQDAVKLKTAQVNQKRRTYDTWPFYVQHTIFHIEKEDPPIKALRQLPFAEKMVICERMKEEGNKLYAEKNWSDAVEQYEMAPTLVYYCYSLDPGWRKNNRGIDDDVVVLVDDHGDTDEDRKAQTKLRLSCALNIAACKLHMQKFDEVIAACTAVLKEDNQNVKAYYRRAEARIRPNSATGYDYDMAIKDLAKAQNIDPKNAAVTKLLTELRADRKVQREKDNKTFSGMFGRGELYDGEGDAAKGGPLAEHSFDSVFPDPESLQERIDNIKEDDDIEKRIKDAELLRDLYMRNGKQDEARDLNEKIKQAKRALERAKQPEPPPDWSNPTPEMIEDAKKHGLDLTDPFVLEELRRLEAEMAAGKDLQSGVEKAAGGPELCVPTAEATVAVPWLRYLSLLTLLFVLFRLADMGVWRKLFAMLWMWTLVREQVGEKVSVFELLRRRVASLFGLEEEEL